MYRRLFRSRLRIERRRAAGLLHAATILLGHYFVIAFSCSIFPALITARDRLIQCQPHAYLMLTKLCICKLSISSCCRLRIERRRTTHIGSDSLRESLGVGLVDPTGERTDRRVVDGLLGSLDGRRLRGGLRDALQSLNGGRLGALAERKALLVGFDRLNSNALDHLGAALGRRLLEALAGFFLCKNFHPRRNPLHLSK